MARAWGRMCGLGLILASGLTAQVPEDDAKNLQDLLKVNTALAKPFYAASMKALTVRESPGIVSLITREEILALGARDLLEVLRMVPGLDFGADNEGVVGLSMRGAWVHEGKVLLQIDGIEMVEGLYGNLQFGGHYPVEEIDTIEIIRGPGSAIYGGYAELCVINVHTRTAKAVAGLAGSLTGSRMPGGFHRTQANLAFGTSFRGLDLTAAAFLGSGPRSDREYADIFGTRFPMGENSRIQNAQVNLGMTYGNWSYRGLFERHELQERDHYIEVLPYPIPILFNTYAHKLQYERTVGEGGMLRAFVSHKQQRPWALPSDPAIEAISVRLAERTAAGIVLAQDLSPTFNLLGGAESQRDHASADLSGLDPSVAPAHFHNEALFFQGLWTAPFGNLTLGARYDRHNQVGSSFSPRLAFTKAWTLVHLKLLAARAFRAPSLQAMELNRAIRPETTTTYEAEVGGSLASGVYATLNLYTNAIRQPIIYANDGESDTYLNSGRMGTRGAEFAIQWTGEHGHVQASWAKAEVHDSTVELYQVPGMPKRALGIPDQKLVLQGLWRIHPGWTLAATMVHTAAKYGYVRESTEDDSGLRSLKAESLVGLFLRHAPAGKPFSLGVGVSNLLNRDTWFVQPYNGGHAPLPGPGREITVRLGYRM